MATGPGRYKGISVRETAGAAAVVEVYDSANSTVAGKPLLGAYNLNGVSANASVSEICDLFFKDGVYVLVVSGAVKGSVRS